jgi:secondary thiamine-phosphate synthase enzyme
MTAVTICPHCGGENQGAKIKCHHCGRLLNSPNVQVEDRGARPVRAIAGTMRGAEVRVNTTGRRVVDITSQVQTFAGGIGQSGLVNAFLPHATAGLGVMETGSGSEEDLSAAIDRLFPVDAGYVHQHGATGHGRDHILPLFISPSVTIPVEDGRILLGTWQRIVVVDFNESNNDRVVRLSFLWNEPPRRAE